MMSLFDATDFFNVGDKIRVTSHVFKFFSIGTVLSINGKVVEIELRHHPKYMPNFYNILSDEYSLDRVV